MKLKTLLLLIICIMLLNNFVYTQSLKLGMRLEPGIIKVKQNSNIQNYPILFSLYGHILIDRLEWFTVEFRPGLTYESEDYSGFELGIYLRLHLPNTKLFLLTGINNHYNNGYYHNSGGSYEKEILYKCLGIGFSLGSRASFDLSYYWTNNKDFAYYRDTDWLTFSRIVNRQLEGIIKLGFSLAWEVLKL